MSDPNNDPDAANFADVLDSLLRPLLRAMIAQGVTAPALYRRAKRLYVEVAEEDFALDGEARPTDSRISLLTGVHRRDVRSFRDPDRAKRDETRGKVTALASVLGRWLADPEVQGPDGAPLPLPRSPAAGLTFEDLVRKVSTDIRPRTILDELQRQGLVDVSDTHVTLRKGAFVGPRTPDQRVHFFAENVGDHISAAVENLLAEEPPFLERAVFYNRLSSDSIETVRAEADRLAHEALIRLNQLAHELQDTDVQSLSGTERFRFGTFFYTETEPPISGGERTQDDED